ncbi:MAG: SRPBCC domain-containing protein [Roseivirga sp.]|nr:SRPBCC domain-containing protein [Roseivirga sp.]
MKSMETQIIIEAGPDQVWAVLMDFESYQHWNPFIIRIKGSATVGTQLDNELRMNDKKSMKFQPEVLVVEEQKEFRWKGKMFVKGLFDGEHYFKLQSNGDGSTTLIHGENFSGVLSGLIMNMIEEDTLKGFEAMNSALKQRVELKGKEVRHAG